MSARPPGRRDARQSLRSAPTAPLAGANIRATIVLSGIRTSPQSCLPPRETQSLALCAYLCVRVRVCVCVRFRVSDNNVLLLTFSGVFVGATAAGLSATPAPPPTPTTPTFILSARRACRCHRGWFTVRRTAPRRVAHRVAAARGAEDTAMRRRATPRPVASSFACGATRAAVRHGE